MQTTRPRVSILVATRDRLQFIPQLVRNIHHQTYPKQLIEVIIADDGKFPIQPHIPKEWVYVGYDSPIPLGQKRQGLNEKATGEVLVCMDDDDYYPPTRVENAVATLLANPTVEFVYAPTMHLYYPHERAVYRCGPWTTNWPHATFAFTKHYAETHSYTKGDQYGEERTFTDFYRVPHALLPVEHTIMALCHNHNTIPKNKLGKRTLLGGAATLLPVLVKDRESIHFYMNRAGHTGGPVSV